MYQFISNNGYIGEGVSPWLAFSEAYGPQASEIVLETLAPRWVNDEHYGYSARVYSETGEYIGIFIKS